MAKILFGVLVLVLLHSWVVGSMTILEASVLESDFSDPTIASKDVSPQQSKNVASPTSSLCSAPTFTILAVVYGIVVTLVFVACKIVDYNRLKRQCESSTKLGRSLAAYIDNHVENSHFDFRAFNTYWSKITDSQREFHGNNPLSVKPKCFLNDKPTKQLPIPSDADCNYYRTLLFILGVMARTRSKALNDSLDEIAKIMKEAADARPTRDGVETLRLLSDVDVTK